MVVAVVAYLSYNDSDYHLRKLKRGVEKRNQALPKQMEEHLTWDSILLEGHKVIYHYTWADPVLENVDLDTLRQELRPELVDYLCKDPETKIFRQAKVDITYEYRDAAGNLIIAIETTVNACETTAEPP